MAISGECFFGGVKYEVGGRLRDARSCHCSRCRKAFNAQASAYALVDPQEFRWTSGEDLLTTYTGKQGFGLQFCSICGSTLCGTFQGKVHGLTLGCVNGDPAIGVIQHIFVGSRALWEVMPEGVPAFQEWPNASD